MKTTLPKIPCGDQLREAWLEAVELHHLASDVIRSLDSAAKLANDEKPDSRAEAKEAKEQLHHLVTKAAAIRDMVTIWQAWASDNSNID